MIDRKRSMQYLKQIAKVLIPQRYHSTISIKYHSLLSILSGSSKMFCPCCERSGYFLQYGVKQRPSAQCPYCKCIERHRLLWLYLKNKTNLFTDNLKVFHVSPAYILQKNLASLSNLNYISADLNSPRVTVKMDMTSLACRNESFDVILCIHVLEHIQNDQKAMRELFRVLRPGGWAIIISPIDPNRDKTFEDPNILSSAERERIFGQQDHVRIYGRDYKNRLEEAGFIVKVDRYVKKLNPDMVKKFGLSEEDIYVCTKKMYETTYYNNVSWNL